LPEIPVPLVESVAVKVGKTPYVRFDLNEYSVPHTHVLRMLTVFADARDVRMTDGVRVVACHPRSYDKEAQIEQPSHIQALRWLSPGTARSGICPADGGRPRRNAAAPRSAARTGKVSRPAIVWLLQEVVEAIHDEQIAWHGG
jgi:hypothetical protein